MQNKKVSKKLPLYIYKDVSEIMTKAYRASDKVLDENERLGIPTPFSLRGRIYYLMPDGRIILHKGGKYGRRRNWFKGLH